MLAWPSVDMGWTAECRKILHEKDVESTLVELLSVVDDSVRAAACQAMAAMSVHTTSKDNFRDLGKQDK